MSGFLVRGRLEGGKVETIDAGWGNYQPDPRLASAGCTPRTSSSASGTNRPAAMGAAAAALRGPLRVPTMAARASRTAGFRRMGAFSLKVGAAAGGGEGGGGGDGTARSATTAGGGAGACDTGGGGDVRAAGDVATSVASSNENWAPGG